MNDFKLNFMHLCDEALFSQDGKLSLIGIFEVINVAAIPGNLLKASLVANIDVLNKDLDKVDLDIIIKNKDTEKEIFKLPTLTPSLNKSIEVNIKRKLGITLTLANIKFPETGKYIIELQANKKNVGSLDFEVKLLKKKGTVN